MAQALRGRPGGAVSLARSCPRDTGSPPHLLLGARLEEELKRAFFAESSQIAYGRDADHFAERGVDGLLDRLGPQYPAHLVELVHIDVYAGLSHLITPTGDIPNTENRTSIPVN